MVAPKTIWIVNQYAATPETGMSGRHRHLARELASRGHRVYVIAARWHHKLQNEEASLAAPFIEEREGFSFVRIDVPRYRHGHDWRRILNWHIFAWKLAMLHRRLPGKPDAILASSPSLLTFIGARHVARKFGARLVFEVRDIWPLSLIEIGGVSPGHPLIRYLQAVEDKAYSEADRVISNLPGAVEHMVERGMDRSKFAWIPNGFSQRDLETSRLASEQVLAAIPGNKFLVGYAGAFGPANSLDTIIRAANLLADNSHIHILLIGSGMLKNDLIKLNSSLGNNNVTILDAVPKSQIQSIISLFSACYLGLRQETVFRFGVSPNKLFDYLVSGKPIIYAVDSGSYRPIEEIGAGVQIPPEDPVAVAQAIRKLYSLNAAERHEMGTNGYRAAMSRYEYRELAKDLERELVGVEKIHPHDIVDD